MCCGLGIYLMRHGIKEGDERERQHYEATHPVQKACSNPNAPRPLPGNEYKSYHKSSYAVPTAAKQGNQPQNATNEDCRPEIEDERMDLTTQGATMPAWGGRAVIL